MNPRASVIIPCTSFDDLTRECVRHCQVLDYDNFEIILLPDLPEQIEGVSVLPTGPGFPGKKRNLGMKVASGEVLAFIDSDAYPRQDWLRNAVRYLQESRVGAVGGPGLTPSTDGEIAQALGDLLGSFLMGGLSARYIQRGAQDSDDIHSVNFVAWKNVIEEAGGWDEYYWPGEDTLMCLAIKKLGYRQLLAPDVVVYHHRRSTWKGYLTQIGRYAVHRGYFAKKFPGNSRRPGYFLPSVMLLVFSLFVLMSPFSSTALVVLVLMALAYLALIVNAVSRNSFRRASIFFIGIPLTHFVYGLGFIKGLASRRLSH